METTLCKFVKELGWADYKKTWDVANVVQMIPFQWVEVHGHYCQAWQWVMEIVSQRHQWNIDKEQHSTCHFQQGCWWAWLSPMLIGHPFSLFWHCLLSLTAPLRPPYNVTYCANHVTWCNTIASARMQHYYRPLIFLVIGLRRSTQAPCFTAPFMPPMTLLGFMCPGPGKLIRSWALSHQAINSPHDTSLFSHSLLPDQLPLLCTSFSFASYHMVYGTRAAMSTPTIAFVLNSPVHTDKKRTNRIHPTWHISLCALASHSHLHLAPHLHFPLCSHFTPHLHLTPHSCLHLHLTSPFTLLSVCTSSSFIRLYTAWFSTFSLI